MKHPNLVLGVCFGFFLLCALSMNNKAYLLISLIIFLAWVYAWLSVKFAEKTVKLENSLSGHTVNRGETVSMEIGVSHHSPLPIAPVVLKMRATANTPAATLRLTQLGRRKQKVTYSFTAEHVGAMFPGVESYTVTDVFGFFKHVHHPGTDGQELLVLPVPFEVQDLEFASGDLGSETMKRAMEDPSSPADIRTYQQGDPLKRIHWKMSARKREIMVRQFEEPALPEALLLLDTSPPQLPPDTAPERAAFLCDALLETAASVVRCQIRRENALRMPLVGDRPMEYSSRMGMPILLEELARCTFNETEQFERVVMMQQGELKKTGAVVVVTTRLSSALTDLIVRMRRTGPRVRMYFCTFTADDPQYAPQVAQLQSAGVEVDYVTP